MLSVDGFREAVLIYVHNWSLDFEDVRVVGVEHPRALDDLGTRFRFDVLLRIGGGPWPWDPEIPVEFSLREIQQVWTPNDRQRVLDRKLGAALKHAELCWSPTPKESSDD